MNGPVQSFASPIILLIAATLFAILFTFILTALRRAKVFPPAATVTLALCTSLLAVIGIMQTFGGDCGAEPSSHTSSLDVLLLPYSRPDGGTRSGACPLRPFHDFRRTFLSQPAMAGSVRLWPSNSLGTPALSRW